MVTSSIILNAPGFSSEKEKKRKKERDLYVFRKKARKYRIEC
jgi:hypothetical protein